MSKQNPITVSIIDYGMGNLFSVERVCKYVGLSAQITSDKKEILASSAVILPGVGAFGNAMANLSKLDLIGVLKDFIESKRPFMAICLGMQLLMTESEEMGSYKGLNILDGKVIKFSSTSTGNIKIPQIGWNRIFRPEHAQKSWENSILKDIYEGEFMYFAHSYYVELENQDMALSFTEYEGTRYCSSIAWKNIFACQFHPERSAGEGIKIYRNFGAVIQGMVERKDA